MSANLALTLPAGFSIVLIIWAALCGAEDVWRLRVSNFLTLGMLAFAIMFLLLTGHTLTGASALQAALGLIVAMLLTLPGYALGKLGAADAKMLMACGLAAGFADVLEIFVIASLLAAALMLLTRYLDRYPWFIRLTSSGPLFRLAPRAGKSFPFAACMAVGVLFSQCLR